VNRSRSGDSTLDQCSWFNNLVLDIVYLTVTLIYNDKTIHDLSGRYAGNQPIIDVIRPKLRRKLANDQLVAHSHGRRLGITMYSTGNRGWSSPAKEFQVGSYFLSLCMYFKCKYLKYLFHNT